MTNKIQWRNTTTVTISSIVSLCVHPSLSPSCMSRRLTHLVPPYVTIVSSSYLLVSIMTCFMSSNHILLGLTFCLSTVFFFLVLPMHLSHCFLLERKKLICSVCTEEWEISTLFSYLQLKMCRPGLWTSDKSSWFDVNAIRHSTAVATVVHFHEIAVSFWRFTMTYAIHTALINDWMQRWFNVLTETNSCHVSTNNRSHHLQTATVTTFSWNMCIQTCMQKNILYQCNCDQK